VNELVASHARINKCCRQYPQFDPRLKNTQQPTPRLSDYVCLLLVPNMSSGRTLGMLTSEQSSGVRWMPSLRRVGRVHLDLKEQQGRYVKTHIMPCNT
jgi:hypothetical protein